MPPGTALPPFYRVTDIDSGMNGKIVHYHIRGLENDTSYFAINETTGQITLAKQLDYETQKTIQFELFARDGALGDSRLGKAAITLHVSNINEYVPKFQNLPYEFFVQEKAVEGTSVGMVKAVDDDGNNIFYSLHDGDHDLFTIESDTGRIYVRKSLIGRSQYNFVARATDDGVPQNFSLGVQITVKIQENNDFAPEFTMSTYQGSVLERLDSDKVVTRVVAQDKDLADNIITYSITGGNDDKFFMIDSVTGEIRLTPGRGSQLNYDEKKQFSLLVQAKDNHQNPLFGLTIVQIDVIDTSKLIVC